MFLRQAQFLIRTRNWQIGLAKRPHTVYTNINPIFNSNPTIHSYKYKCKKKSLSQTCRLIDQLVPVAYILELEALSQRIEHVEQCRAAYQVHDTSCDAQAAQEAHISVKSDHVGSQAALFVEKLASVAAVDVALLAALRARVLATGVGYVGCVGPVVLVGELVVVTDLLIGVAVVVEGLPVVEAVYATAVEAHLDPW